ncbi:MAG: MAPEG family protein [Alphaproteobacteria bacterium]|nr:MAG: MAPEG family protein [Alphaproteobacteria bacterium]
MNGTEILQSVVALAAWTMVMWLWMYATRLPAMGKVPDLDTKNLVGGTGKDLDNILPAKVQWIAHNYNHLHEAPTVFYAVALVLAVTGQGGGLNATLGWAYVGLRVLHSLVQVTSNRIMVRFSVFVLSSLVLIALVVHAAIAVF